MYFTIGELSQSSSYRRRTSHATPARSDHSGVGPLRATLFAAELAPCASVTPGGDSDAGSPDSHRCLAGDGLGGGVSLHELSSGVEPGHVVSTPGQPDSARSPHYAAGAPGSNDRARGG